MHGEIEIACRKDGTILALRGSVHADMGAYIRTNGATAPAQRGASAGGSLSRAEHPHRIASLLATNKTPIGTYRGPGRFEADFFRERLIDLAARDLGLDRVEFRRRNLIAEREMPWTHAGMAPYGGGEYDSGDYRDTFERCLAGIPLGREAGARRQG